MFERLIVWFQENKKTILILIVIMAVGIFLRTYRFHDWMRFSVDQSRDAKIISAAVDGKKPLPLLGPKANLTSFQLGPAFYYFSYISAEIFGNTPDKMAYPSLLFGVLTIPLFFLFLREYFGKRTSAFLTAIFSVSYFMVINSRFSSNPNLVPFFLLLYLYSLLKILNGQGKASFGWSILAGIGLGIGIQLHTTLFVIMPLMTISAFIYLFRKKFAYLGKIILIIIATSILLNVTQIVSGINTGWFNYKSFMAGFRDNSEGNLLNQTLLISACQVQANFSIVSSVVSPLQLEEDSRNVNCEDVFKLPRLGNFHDYAYYAVIFAGTLFSLAGYFFLIYRAKIEQGIEKKNFLRLILTFNLISFIILIPVAEMMQTEYFIILFFVPFVLLGLLFDETRRVKYIHLAPAPLILSLILIVFSLVKDYKAATQYVSGAENNSRNSTLGETELMSKFIISNSANIQKLYFSGEKELYNRYYKPLSYFVERSGREIILLDPSLKSVYDPGEGEKVRPSSGIPIFYIQKNNTRKSSPGEITKDHRIVYGHKFSSQTILNLEN